MLLLALAVFALASTPGARPPQDPAPAPAAPATGAEAELARCEEFAAALQVALEKGDLVALKACIDVDALLEKGTRGIDCDADFRKGFIEGARDSLLTNFKDSVHGILQKEGSLRLLRIRTRDGQRLPLFRLLPPDGGVEYFEFELRAGAEGRMRAIDWHSFATGEWVSETVRHLYLPLALQSQRGLIDRLLGRDELLARHWSKIEKLVECVTNAQLEPGLEAYAALPVELRRDKFVLLLRLRLLSGHTDHKDYLRVLGDLRRYCPNDPANELHSIDYYYLRGLLKKSAEAVRRLREVVEGDPYLDCMEATILLEADDLPAARAAIERSLAGEPERLPSHWVLVSVCLKQKDHAAVLAELKRIDGQFVVEWNDLTEVDGYTDFAAAPEHAQWLAYRAAKK